MHAISPLAVDMGCARPPCGVRPDDVRGGLRLARKAGSPGAERSGGAIRDGMRRFDGVVGGTNPRIGVDAGPRR